MTVLAGYTTTSKDGRIITSYLACDSATNSGSTKTDTTHPNLKHHILTLDGSEKVPIELVFVMSGSLSKCGYKLAQFKECALQEDFSDVFDQEDVTTKIFKIVNNVESTVRTRLQNGDSKEDTGILMMCNGRLYEWDDHLLSPIGLISGDFVANGHGYVKAYAAYHLYKSINCFLPESKRIEYDPSIMLNHVLTAVCESDIYCRLPIHVYKQECSNILNIVTTSKVL